LRRALEKENQKAVKYQAEKPASLPSMLGGNSGGGVLGSLAGPRMNGPSFISRDQSIMNNPHQSSMSALGMANHLTMPANLDSFAKNRGLIVGERVDHVAAN
jgi:hypothetical protein